jgi:hypothetical protein
MKTIGDLLTLVLDREIQGKLTGQAKLKSDWAVIVEKAYAGNRNIRSRYEDEDVYRDEILERDRINIQKAAYHSRPAYIKNNVLFVEADHQGWIQILQTVRKRIIEIINKEYSSLSIRSIAFLLVNYAGLVVSADQKTDNEREVKEYEPEGKVNEEAYKNIMDERLRKILMCLESRINTGKN